MKLFNGKLVLIMVFAILFVSCYRKMSSYKVKPVDKKEASWIVKLKERFKKKKKQKEDRKVKKKSGHGSDRVYSTMGQGKRKKKREEGLFPAKMRWDK